MSENISIRDWLMPAVAFVLFLYFLLFLVLYTVKISSSEVRFYNASGKQAPKERGQIQNYLGDISKNFKEGY